MLDDDALIPYPFEIKTLGCNNTQGLQNGPVFCNLVTTVVLLTICYLYIVLHTLQQP